MEPCPFCRPRKLCKANAAALWVSFGRRHPTRASRIHLALSAPLQDATPKLAIELATLNTLVTCNRFRVRHHAQQKKNAQNELADKAFGRCSQGLRSMSPYA
eukprot:5446758-Amphidinium_carterae.1